MRYHRGFTLIELLVVIAIIGILSAVVLASLGTARERAQDASIKSTLKNMAAEIELQYESNGDYNFVNTCTGTSSPLSKFVTQLQAQNATVACYSHTATGDVYQRWGVAVRSNDTSVFKGWGVAPDGAFVWDTADISGSAITWDVGASSCSSSGGRIPALEPLKAMQLTGLPSGAFVSTGYWSVTDVPNSTNMYAVGMTSGGTIGSHTKTYPRNVRCVR